MLILCSAVHRHPHTVIPIISYWMCSIVHPHPCTKMRARTNPHERRREQTRNSLDPIHPLIVTQKKIQLPCLSHPETPWSFIIQVAKIIQKICCLGFCVGNHGKIFHPEKAFFQNLGHCFFSRQTFSDLSFLGAWPSFPLATVKRLLFHPNGWPDGFSNDQLQQICWPSSQPLAGILFEPMESGPCSNRPVHVGREGPGFGVWDTWGSSPQVGWKL